MDIHKTFVKALFLMPCLLSAPHALAEGVELHFREVWDEKSGQYKYHREDAQGRPAMKDGKVDIRTAEQLANRIVDGENAADKRGQRAAEGSVRVKNDHGTNNVKLNYFIEKLETEDEKFKQRERERVAKAQKLGHTYVMEQNREPASSRVLSKANHGTRARYYLRGIRAARGGE